jgi:hypothetical protein
VSPSRHRPAGLVVLVVAVAGSSAASATSLRFHGEGVGDVDRVRIRVDDSANPKDETGPPVDVGATDFTWEFFVKGLLAENDAAEVSCGPGESWIHGNVLFDRGRQEPGGREFGLSLGAGRVAFGVTNAALESRTVCGATVVLDGDWHHVAVQRGLGGLVEIWVDGALDAWAAGPAGDVSYPGDATPTGTNRGGGLGVDSHPSLLIGAGKREAGSTPFSGWVDEIRVSNVLRYTVPFSPPTSPFAPDAQTAALYHLDEGAGDAILDSSGASRGPSPGERRLGGSPVRGPEWSSDTPFAAGASGLARPSLPAGAVPRGVPQPPARSGDPLRPIPGRALRRARDLDPRRRGRTVARSSRRADGRAAMVVWDGRVASGEVASPGFTSRSPHPSISRRSSRCAEPGARSPKEHELRAAALPASSSFAK